MTTAVCGTLEAPARLLVAGFGNLLRRDDAFGVLVAQRLLHERLPCGVMVHEAGIAGLTVVQELLDGYDGLLVVDAVDRGGVPGTLYELEPTIPDVAALGKDGQFDFFADMHYAEPGRAMALARALGVLPRSVVVLGCQVGEAEEYGLGLTPEVEAALGPAVTRTLRIVARMAADCQQASAPGRTARRAEEMGR